MYGWPLVTRSVSLVLISLSIPAPASGQTGLNSPVPATTARVSMADAVRLALAHNHQLLAERLNVDVSKADEITAALKPNPVLTSTNENFPLFTPSQLTFDNIANNQNFVQSLSYLFERGGKREKRTLVAQDATEVAARNVIDAERQLTLQTGEAFINVLLAKSTLDLARENLADFASVEDVNRERVRVGDLAEGDFFKILLQKLQFEQDLSASEVALAQAKGTLRQSLGLDSVPRDFDVDGDLSYSKYTVMLADLQTDALAARPDLLAARSNTKLARDNQTLAYANRTRDLVGQMEYDRAGSLNALGFGISIELPFHDKNQGNIAHSIVAVRQASEAEAAATDAVLTDVANAYAAFQTSEKVVSLFQAGYLDQARQSLDITTYVFQQGSGSLLDLLDAERTYRATELAFRQALANYMLSVQQINFVVGRQVLQ